MPETPPGNFWTALPSILWVTLVGSCLFIFRAQLFQILSQLLLRIRAGAPMKVGGVEIGAVLTAQWHTPAPIAESSIPEGLVSQEGPGTIVDPQLKMMRDNYMMESRKLMLVHRLFRSEKADQVYDVLIYLTPHGDGSLASVTEVGYYFGRYWGYKVFAAYDRSRGFPILTSAYGTFLCTCRVKFNDGAERTLYRYIDFEMGAYAPVLVEPP
jgi:hypothetical protein